MQLNVKGMGMAAGLVWGGGILITGLAATCNGVTEGAYYGKDFLLAMASIYPGYQGLPTVGDSIAGGLYGLLDGGICGAIFAWLYNCCSGCGAKEE